MEVKRKAVVSVKLKADEAAEAPVAETESTTESAE
jgi:hypothetical protein